MSGPDEEGTAVNTRKVAAAFLSNPDTRGVTSSFLSPPGLIRGSMPWPGAMSPAWGMGCRVLGPSWGERPQPLSVRQMAPTPLWPEDRAELGLAAPRRRHVDGGSQARVPLSL